MQLTKIPCKFNEGCLRTIQLAIFGFFTEASYNKNSILYYTFSLVIEKNLNKTKIMHDDFNK